MDNFFSIIIPTKVIDQYVKECLKGINRLDYKDIEVILLPDDDETLEDSWFFDLIIIPTGQVKPSHKRNIGIKEARGNVVVFIDSDARPFTDWLNNAIGYLNADEVGAVGGPNITPPEDSLMQKASGDILASSIAWGAFAIRNKVANKFEKGLPVKELPSCNLIVKKEVAQDIGGFDTSLLTAEDAKLCFEIRKLGKNVIYAPDVKVYHHRRSLFLPHLKQMFIYGRDKMWVLKEDFSIDKIYYFIPLFFVGFLVLGLFISFLNKTALLIYVCLILTYLCIVFCGSLLQNLKRSFLIFPGIILTHICYGIGSLYGLLARRNAQ